MLTYGRCQQSALDAIGLYLMIILDFDSSAGPLFGGLPLYMLTLVFMAAQDPRARSRNTTMCTYHGRPIDYIQPRYGPQASMQLPRLQAMHAPYSGP